LWMPSPAAAAGSHPARAPRDACMDITRSAARLRRVPATSLETSDLFVALQATVARLYGLSRTQMAAILATTPHLAAATRAAILARLDDARDEAPGVSRR